MHFTSDSTSADGIRERGFVVDDIPGILWEPAESTDAADAGLPTLLLAHGGGQHKAAPGVVARARRFVTSCGFAAVAIDAPHHGDRPRDPDHDRYAAELRARMASGEPVESLLAEDNSRAAVAAAEWSRVLDALGPAGLVTGPIGFWGMSLGCATGIPLVASDARITSAVLGLAGQEGLAAPASTITAPVQFLVQWDDEFIARNSALALFDAIGSTDKTLHANPGGHLQLPRHEFDSAEQFFVRTLVPVS